MIAYRGQGYGGGRELDITALFHHDSLRGVEGHPPVCSRAIWNSHLKNKQHAHDDEHTPYHNSFYILFSSGSMQRVRSC